MLVTTAWLAARLDDPDVVVVDMRWREDGSGPDLFERGRIPGSVFLDWSTDLIQADHPIAFTLAPADRFGSVMARCGIGDDTVVVAYADQLGSGPYRLWLASSVYGHANVRVLDGGLERWVAEGRALTRETAPRDPATWTPRRGAQLLVGADEVAETANDPGAVVLDSRPADQFRGTFVWFETGPIAADPDGIARTPRGELRAGRIPWAASVPIAGLYRPDGTMKPPDELRALFEKVGVGPATRVITYCGVAISASGLAFGLRLAGVEDVAVYEASWEERGRDPARPVARG